MWIPRRIVDWFGVNAEILKNLQNELSAVRAERDLLTVQLATSQAHFDWVKTRINALEIERAQLLKKAYDINVVVPEIVRTVSPSPFAPDGMLDHLPQDLFEDMGDEKAKEFGFPVYGNGRS